jgi:hypothetical protein
VELLGTPKCMTCAHAHKGGEGKYACRRYPPTPHPIVVVDEVQTPDGPRPMPRMLGKLATFSEVNDDWWCGEYKRSLLVPSDSDGSVG